MFSEVHPPALDANHSGDSLLGQPLSDILSIKVHRHPGHFKADRAVLHQGSANSRVFWVLVIQDIFSPPVPSTSASLRIECGLLDRTSHSSGSP